MKLTYNDFVRPGSVMEQAVNDRQAKFNDHYFQELSEMGRYSPLEYDLQGNVNWTRLLSSCCFISSTIT